MHWLKQVRQKVWGIFFFKQCPDFSCSPGVGAHSRLAAASLALDAAFHPHKGAASPPAFVPKCF